jgi:hypothetical protein
MALSMGARWLARWWSIVPRGMADGRSGPVGRRICPFLFGNRSGGSNRGIGGVTFLGVVAAALLWIGGGGRHGGGGGDHLPVLRTVEKYAPPVVCGISPVDWMIARQPRVPS